MSNPSTADFRVPNGNRHWIYIGPLYWGNNNSRAVEPPAWHYSPNADSYGEEGRTFCGQIFAGSPIVSSEAPEHDICFACSEVLKTQEKKNR